MTGSVDPALLAAVEAAVWQRSARKRGREYTFRCPAHSPDDHPSARWNREKQTWYCDACGTGGGAVDLARALGIIPAGNENVIAYRMDRNGRVPLEHRRYIQEGGGKRFGWYRGGETGLKGRPANTLPLYGIDDLEPGPVVVTEGEKARDALVARGIQAVATVCGASQIPTAPVLAPLLTHGITLWPDNDDPGRAHMEGINRALRELGVETVRVVDWPSAPEKGDAADHTGSDDDVLALIAASRDTVPDVAQETAPERIPRPSIDTSLPDTLRFTWPGQVTVRAEQIWRDRHGTHAWLTWWTATAGTIYGPDRLNMQSASGKAQLLRELREREPRSWAEYLQHIVYLTDQHLRNDGETLTAATYTPKPEPPWLLWPLVKDRVVNVWFADGGAGKSTLGVGLCVSGAAGRAIIPGITFDGEPVACFFVDFEASADDVIGAAHLMAAGAELPDGWQERFIYRRFGGTLADRIATIQRIVVEHRVRLVVIDSLVGSAGSDPNEAETARVFFAASSSLPGCAVVGMAHMSKGAQGSRPSPLGSVMYRNLPRVVWELKRDEDSNVVGLYPNKINTIGRRPAPFALTLETGPGLMRYQLTDIGSVPALADSTTVAAKVAHALGMMSMTIAEIVAEIPDGPRKPSAGTVGKTLNRGKGTLFSQNPATGTWSNLVGRDTLGKNQGEPGRDKTYDTPLKGGVASARTPCHDMSRDTATSVASAEEQKENLPWETP